jgi:hypothetical protein
MRKRCSHHFIPSFKHLKNRIGSHTQLAAIFCSALLQHFSQPGEQIYWPRLSFRNPPTRTAH